MREPLRPHGMVRRTRIALADDHAEVLEEIRQVLEPEFEVVSTASDGAALMRHVQENRPDAVVADANMPGCSGVEAGRQIVGQGLCSAIVILTMYAHPQLVEEAFRAGIRGYVLKEDAGEELIPALRAVLDGGQYRSRRVKPL